GQGGLGPEPQGRKNGVVVDQIFQNLPRDRRSSVPAGSPRTGPCAPAPTPRRSRSWRWRTSRSPTCPATRPHRGPPVARAAQSQRRTGELGEWQHVIDGSERDRLARHTEHDAGRLVLGERAGAGALHRPQALRAVRTHAGQDHADGVGPGGGGGRGEEHVDRRPVPVDPRTVLQRHAVALAVATDAQVEIARRDQRMTWPDAVAVPRLLDPDGTALVTGLGEAPRDT